MSDDELKDLEYTDNQHPDFDKSAADILNLAPDIADRLNGFLKNQYCRSLVQASWKNTLIQLKQIKMLMAFKKCKLHMCVKYIGLSLSLHFLQSQSSTSVFKIWWFLVSINSKLYMSCVLVVASPIIYQ